MSFGFTQLSLCFVGELEPFPEERLSCVSRQDRICRRYQTPLSLTSTDQKPVLDRASDAPG